MPIYEFYCKDCHTIYNFFSRRISTDGSPDCPRCGLAELVRQVSLFSVSKGRGDDEEGGPDGLDESQMEKAIESMSGEFANIDEGDPKQMARLMRRLYDSTGLKIGAGMEEAICRMEAGDNPDRIEEELGDVLEQEDPFAGGSATRINDLRRKFLPPKVDETLYEM